MTSNFNYQKRQLIPRWYPFEFACLLGEIQALRIAEKPKIFTPDSYNKKINDWLCHRSPIYALELIGTALIAEDFKNQEVIEAAKLISKGKNESLFAKEIAAIILSPEGIASSQLFSNYTGNKETAIRKNISYLKSKSSFYLHNPITWIDLAFYYCILGQDLKAEKAIRISLNLGGENRFILRSASRYYLHRGDLEKSLHLLKKAKLSKHDPWLTASEIAISDIASKSIPLIKQARSFLSDINIHVHDKTELAGALSTLEFSHGNNRAAKKLLTLSLEQPNENAVAQAQWLSDKINYEINIEDYKIPALFEAQYRQFKEIGNFNDAFLSTKQWLRFQPFTSTPAVLGSYIASVALQNDSFALNIIEDAMKASPKSFYLLNNYAFSLASLNRVTEAEQCLQQNLKNIDPSDLDQRAKATLAATIGLIMYRKGMQAEGQKKYLEAINIFKEIREPAGILLAKLFMAREELRFGNTISNLLIEISSLNEKVKLPEITKYISILSKPKIISPNTESPPVQ